MGSKWDGSKFLDSQWHWLIQIAPTRIAPSNASTAPSGRWRLGFLSLSDQCKPIHVYTCWGGRNDGFPQRIMPTKFFASENKKDWVEILGAGSVLGSGCGKKPLLIGGHEKWGSKQRSPYSGAGKPRGGEKKGADWLAPSEESPSLPGLLCIGTRSGIVRRVAGTSVAAPQAARAFVALGTVDKPALKEEDLKPDHPAPGQQHDLRQAKSKREFSDPRLSDVVPS